MLSGIQKNDDFFTSLSLSSRGTTIMIFGEKWIKEMKILEIVYNLFARQNDDPGSEGLSRNQILQDKPAHRIQLTYEY